MNAAELFPISLQEQLICVEREIAMRRRVYPRFIEQGRMKLDRAEREIAAMEAVAETIRRLSDTHAELC